MALESAERQRVLNDMLSHYRPVAIKAVVAAQAFAKPKLRRIEPTELSAEVRSFVAETD